MAAVKTYGSCIDHMIVKAPFAIKMALGENPKSVYHGKNQAPSTRMSTAALIREQLYKAKRYQGELERAEKDEDFDMPEFDMKCEALLPALRREIQVHFHAHRADAVSYTHLWARPLGSACPLPPNACAKPPGCYPLCCRAGSGPLPRSSATSLPRSPAVRPR